MSVKSFISASLVTVMMTFSSASLATDTTTENAPSVPAEKNITTIISDDKELDKSVSLEKPISEPINLVNINTANIDELSAGLSGVGKIKAQAIITYREENGAFDAVDSLTNVKGIGPATLEKNRDRIQL